MPSPPASCPNAADAARACTQSCAAGHRNDLPWRVHGPPAPQEQPAQPAASCCGPLAPWTARPPAHPPARRPPACPPTLPTGTLCRGWRDRANGPVPPVFWRGPVHINVRNFGGVPYMLILQYGPHSLSYCGWVKTRQVRGPVPVLRHGAPQASRHGEPPAQECAGARLRRCGGVLPLPGFPDACTAKAAPCYPPGDQPGRYACFIAQKIGPADGHGIRRWKQ
jgi:hypothetical protein